MPTLVGLVHRPRLNAWIRNGPGELECLEISADQFYKVGDQRLRTLASTTSLVVHGAGLSLGTPGPVALQDLDWLARVVRLAGPLWVGAQLGFRRAGGVDLVHHAPFLLTGDALIRVSEQVRAVMERCGKRLLLTNIGSPLRLPNELSEPDFLNRLCEASGTGIRLSVGALLANDRNGVVPAHTWLNAVDAGRVVQIHLGGTGQERGCWFDAPGTPIPEEAWEVAARVLAESPVRALVLDVSGSPATLLPLLERARRLVADRAPADAPSAPHIE